MPTGHAFMAMSLDGFVARQNHGLDWLMKQNTAGEDHGYDAFFSKVDGLVMGSGSYKTALTFDAWPYEKPVIVMSHSLTNADIPDDLRDKVFLTSLTPKQVMHSLADRGWRRVYIDGGKIIQSFMRGRLIVDMTVTLIPILIGEGKRMFGTLDADIDLELQSAQPYPSGLLTLKYKVL